MAYEGQMPRLFRLDNLQDRGGYGGNDLLIELVQVTYATVTTVSVPTVFANGNIIAVFATRVSGSGTYTIPKTVASSALTMTNTVTTSTDVVDVMIIGRLQV
jgi:hypothetical protein